MSMHSLVQYMSADICCDTQQNRNLHALLVLRLGNISIGDMQVWVVDVPVLFFVSCTTVSPCNTGGCTPSSKDYYVCGYVGLLLVALASGHIPPEVSGPCGL